MITDALPQLVVLYDGKGETGRIFTTAYSDPQIQRAITHCRRVHGQRCNARLVNAQRRAEGRKR